MPLVVSYFSKSMRIGVSGGTQEMRKGSLMDVTSKRLEVQSCSWRDNVFCGTVLAWNLVQLAHYKMALIDMEVQ